MAHGKKKDCRVGIALQNFDQVGIAHLALSRWIKCWVTNSYNLCFLCASAVKYITFEPQRRRGSREKTRDFIAIKLGFVSHLDRASIAHPTKSKELIAISC
jgi:hypothetical protein